MAQWLSPTWLYDFFHIKPAEAGPLKWKSKLDLTVSSVEDWVSQLQQGFAAPFVLRWPGTNPSTWVVVTGCCTAAAARFFLYSCASVCGERRKKKNPNTMWQKTTHNKETKPAEFWSGLLARGVPWTGCAKGRNSGTFHEASCVGWIRVCLGG